MAFTLKINDTPHEVDVDGDTPPVCRLAARNGHTEHSGGCALFGVDRHYGDTLPI